MEGNLFNSGFLGSKFLWWIGQVADDRTWRENQNPHKIEDPKEETPAWGYRYKVRIMGCHDKDESSLSSDNLPWAQVMYSVWGGGLAGSRQTPGIRQGMFVFGFFLDGADQQVPVIMGVLGANAKTVVKDLKTGISEGGENFVPQSGWANADKDETKVVPDEQIATTEPSSVGTTEATDVIHQETVQDKKMKDVLDKRHALACPDPLHQSDTKNLATMVEELSRKIEARQRAEEDYASAVAIGLPINPMSNDIEKMIDDAAGEMSGPMKGIMMQAQQKTTHEHNLKMLLIYILAIPTWKNILLLANILALKKIACKFNEIAQGLPALIKGALMAAFMRKANQAQTPAVQSANAAEGKGTSGTTASAAPAPAAPTTPAPTTPAPAAPEVEVSPFAPPPNLNGTDASPPSQTIPTGTVTGTPTSPPSYSPSLPDDVSKGIQLPSPPPKGYYQPSPICSTEELLGEVLGATINKITAAYGSASDTILSAANDGTNPDIESEVGEEDEKVIDMSISKRNVTAALKKGTLISGMASVFATAVGVDKNVIGRVTRAFQQGQYGYALETMAVMANAVGTDTGRERLLSNLVSQIDGGDIAGGFQQSASLFGVPPGVGALAALGVGFAAIKSGDMGALTSAVQDMGATDPAIMGSVAGAADTPTMDTNAMVEGTAASSGVEVDIAESMNFVQTIIQMFDCDPEFECSPNDEHTLGEGGSGAKDEPNCASIAEAADNAREFEEDEYEEVEIKNARGEVTGTRKVLKG